MSSTDHNAAQRRRQVLDAARERFAADGFHGSNMAAIAKSAKMSVGHIYHYFANKEAIIVAIVEDDVARLLELFDEAQEAGDIAAALADRVQDDLDERLTARGTALELEVLAEAARNPRIAEVVREADARLHDRVRALYESNPSFASKSPVEVEARIELAAALFDGLVIRQVRNPSTDRRALVAGIRAFMSWLNA